MNDEHYLQKMFNYVNGDIDADSSSCRTRLWYDEYYDVHMNIVYDLLGIEVLKDDNLCWSKTKHEILFDYIAKRDFGELIDES
ncbi:MAG: hypothetical protein ACO23H_12035 [Alphaproteobacteria bacterium]